MAPSSIQCTYSCLYKRRNDATIRPLCDVYPGLRISSYSQILSTIQRPMSPATRVSLSVDLLVPEDMSNLPDDKPHGEDSDGPKTKVEVDVSDRSHDRHAAEAILQRLGQ